MADKDDKDDKNAIVDIQIRQRSGVVTHVPAESVERVIVVYGDGREVTVQPGNNVTIMAGSEDDSFDDL